MEYLGYTAIGNVISRSYFLTLEAEVCCCYSNPKIQLHTIFVTSLLPEIDEEENVQPPQNWNPIVAPPVALTNLKPYLYQPAIPGVIVNQGGVQMMPMPMGNQMPFIPNQTETQLNKY